MEILKVSSHSSPNSVAGAIAGVIREQKEQLRFRQWARALQIRQLSL